MRLRLLNIYSNLNGVKFGVNTSLRFCLLCLWQMKVNVEGTRVSLLYVHAVMRKDCLFITTTDELACSSDGKEGIVLMSRTGKNFIWWTAMERNKSCRN